MVIKKYFDIYRRKNDLPPEIKGKVIGQLFADMAVLEKWRNWRNSDLCYEDKDLKAVLIGALDDCLTNDGRYIPLDYKTRGSGLIEDPRKYYQNQLDCYCLMLEYSGFKTKGLAYLVYYWPEEVCQAGVVKFHVEPIKIETDIESAKKTINDAVKMLSLPMPQSSSNCEYCGLVASRKDE